MKKLLLSILVLGVANGMFAYKSEGHHSPAGGGDSESRAAGCSPANEKIFMEFNNVRALVETGGSLWQDRANSNPSYEYPVGSENHLVYSGALWMGGEDVNGQLKLAAHMFRQGNDFWPGPLGDLIAGTGNYDPFVPQNADVTLFRDFGAAEIFPAECTKYDDFFTVRKSEVLRFIAWWNCENGISDPNDCEDVERPDQEILDRIENWPAHGNESLGQDFYLAPFYDNALEGETGNGIYDPIADGDYPYYDIEEEIDCRNDRRVTLFGDETNWWVFNDKGNIHTESGGDPIGMEIRAQAFSFATDDEINDMTFYNYELINRGTQTLFETYFGQWMDADVGLANDDYVGCDVTRGLGYSYNGDLNDEGGAGGQPGYGSNIPAVGVDFFEGPYLDNDGQDNPLYKENADASGPAVLLPEVFARNGIPYPGLGIGYGDEVIDNERFGMQRFVYHDIGGGQYGDPSSAADFYNYLRGVWKNGLLMQFGGNGNTTGSGVATKFMFPDDSDELGWGTYPAAVPSTDAWSEISVDNAPGDRRFLQSAGPFTLRPGAVNNITVGVVVGQSSETDLEASVRALKTADTKAQALFDNCFELVDPPVAPALTIQEMENELILYLSDPPGLLVPLEEYVEEDNINIITPDELIGTPDEYDKFFRFEGFQVYQMADALASVSEIGDLAKARLVAQTDLENGIGKLVNYTYDEELDISIPAVMVEPTGEFPLDGGLRRSFRVTEDLFATGNRTLVNHKKYYYIAVSYAYNQYKEYDPNDPTLLDGQKVPYLRSRISATGSGIESVVGIPHDPSPEADGRIFTTSYGFQPEITQIEGIGNGGSFLELTQGSVDDILTSNKIDHPIYQAGAGPINVKVIDPLTLKGGDYTLLIESDSASFDDNLWALVRTTTEGGVTTSDTVRSVNSLSVVREQLILDWGLSVQLEQQEFEGGGSNAYTPPIGATIEFADSSLAWCDVLEDDDSFYPSNWIRVGNSMEAENHGTTPNPACIPDLWYSQPCHYDDFSLDAEDQLYEQLLNGGIAPFKFVGKGPYGNPFGFPGENSNTSWYNGGSDFDSWFTSARNLQIGMKMDELHDVDIIITDDKTKWTHCPVIEMNNIEDQTEHGDEMLVPRSDRSVDKNGLSLGQNGYNPAEAESVNAFGMGWFPGYAVDVNTGKRLNMMFGENSWLLGENGADMIWNPTSNYSDNVGVPLFGGMHYVYVFSGDIDDSPEYDGGKWLRDKLDYDVSSTARNSNYREVWNACQWVFAPMLESGQNLLSTDVKISARINIPYDERDVNGENGGYPIYQFSFDNPSIEGDGERLVSVIENINIVPNPYYAYSEYETGKRDNRVKVTNLPERCEVNIFNMQGALVRNFAKDDPLTSIEWDLKNHQGIPIAGGMYIVHVTIEVEENGSMVEYEKILKWYGVLRQPDLDNL